MKKISFTLVIALLLCFTGTYAQNYTIKSIAGNGNAGYTGDGASDTLAEFVPWGLAIDNSGNIYIADAYTSHIRKINTAGIISTIAGNGTATYQGDGGPATNASLYQPLNIALDASGNLYVADESNSRIRMINTSGTISTVVGTGAPGYLGDGGDATNAELTNPSGITFDLAGNMYIADEGASCVRKVDNNGTITTLAGTGVSGYSGDGGAGTAAKLYSPYEVATDAAGDVYITDPGSFCVREVNTNGIISTFAGNGNQGNTGDGGAATAAKLSTPHGISIDANGNVYISDEGNNNIRKVATNGIISTIAGAPTAGFSGDGGPATAAELSYPSGVVANNSNIYIADQYNYRIRELTPPACTMTASVAAYANPTCYGDTNGYAQILETGGTAPVTYSWSNGNTGSIAHNLAAGSFTVTVTDAGGCTATVGYTLTQPTMVNDSNPVFVNPTCNGSSNGSISLGKIEGGVPPYTLLWNNGATTDTISNLTAGTYSVTITDSYGCVTPHDTTLTQPAAMVANFTNVNVTCYSGNTGTATAVLTGGGIKPITFLWSNGTTSNYTSNLAAGVYTLTATDSHGCTVKATDTITQPTLIGDNPTITNISCYGNSNGSAIVNAYGGNGSPYTYSWSTGQTTQSVNSLAVGTYTVNITDSLGCGANTTITITQPSQLRDSVSSSTNVLCNGGNNGMATVGVFGGTAPYSFAWSPTGQTTQTVSGLFAGTYSILVTDANGCNSNINEVITEPAALTASITSSTNPTCNGSANGTATPFISGGVTPYTFAWSNGTTFEVANTLSAGTSTLTATDANGCLVVTTVSLTNPTLLTATIASSTNPSCAGNTDGTATALATGGTAPYSYSWNNTETGVTATGLAAGSYTVSVTDANKCAAPAVSVTLTNPAAVSVLINPASTAICLGSSISLTASGAANYTWSPSTGLSYSAGSVVSASPSFSTTYTVTGTIAVGCTGTQTVSISVEPVPTVTVTTFNSQCGGALGSATAAPSGGTSPYTYIWSNGNNSSVAANLNTGVYQVTVVDANNCSVDGSATINNTNGPTVTASVTNASCSGNHNGAVSLTVTGGTAPYHYSWTTGNVFIAACTAAKQDTIQTINNLGAGTYQVTVTDAAGCTSIQSFTISEPSLLGITASSTNATCLQTDGSASVTVTGGTTPYMYSWNNAATTTSASMPSLGAGVYTVMVTDNNGCTASAVALINNTSGPVIGATSVTNYDCVNQTPGSVTVADSNGTSPYNYMWSNGETTQNLTNVVNGTYYVTIIDNNGCIGTASAMVGNELPLGLPICIVTVDTNQKNLIIWSRTAERRIASYNIYRKSSTGSSYSVVGNVCASENSEFFDSVANSHTLSYTYEISEIDSCGNESPTSPSLNTIHLTASLAAGDTSISLIWNPYEGVFGNYYYIYRDTIKGLYTKHDSVSNTTLSYIDLKPLHTSKVVYYCIGTENPMGCTPTARTFAINYNATKSNTGNITFNPILGVNELSAEINSLEVYPNPTSGLCTLSIVLNNNQNVSIQVLNTVGQVLWTDNNQNVSGSLKKQIDLSDYSKGMYFVKVVTGKTILYRKVVVQ